MRKFLAKSALKSYFFGSNPVYLDLVAHIHSIVGECLPEVAIPSIAMKEEGQRSAVSCGLREMGLMGIEPKRLTEAEKQQLIDILLQHGVFDKKGAISDVAEQLDVSESTIYRYISASARRKRKAEQ